jgi:probable HAF family extracellular repeat protein
LNPGGTFQDLGTSSDGSAAYAINNSGGVVGAFAAPNNITKAFVYTPNGGMQTLGGLDGTTTVALGINASGTIVGYSAIASGVSHAVTWNGGGPALDMGITDQLDSIAHAINSTGAILGRYDTDAADAAPDAFIFSGTLPPLDLGAFGGEYSLGLSINDSGEAVGDFLTTDGGYHGFLYDSTGGHDLNDLIDPSSGWIITVANGINNSGQIVGEGINPQGQYEEYLLTPIPEPSTALLLAVGATILIGFRARAIHRGGLR